MGLFDKKYCDICGEKIGLFGNKKLEDGNMCKNCARKLSPWFQDRRHTDLAGIKEQLAYREDNADRVREFHTTRSIGEGTKVLLDEDARRFMVTAARDLEEENPDVLDFADVTGCVLDVDENRTELMREDNEGHEKPYNPRRYEYNYNFFVQINVNNPYFDEMRFRLNTSSVIIEASASFGRMEPTNFHPERDMEYRKYRDMAEEIKAALTEVRESVREEVAAAAAPKAAVTCPWCGATTTPDASGCCEYCGGSING